MYAELSIQLVTRNSGISPWYVIVLALPHRRYAVRDVPARLGRRVPLMPDALHLHALVFRRIALPLERRRAREQPAGHAGRPVGCQPVCFALAVLFSATPSAVVPQATRRLRPGTGSRPVSQQRTRRPAERVEDADGVKRPTLVT